MRRVAKMSVVGSVPNYGPKKHEKFRELAESRTNRALEAIRRIGNLSNRQLYEYEEGEVKKVIKVLRDAVADIEAKFASPKGRAGGKFKL